MSIGIYNSHMLQGLCGSEQRLQWHLLAKTKQPVNSASVIKAGNDDAHSESRLHVEKGKPVKTVEHLKTQVPHHQALFMNLLVKVYLNAFVD